MGERNGAVQPPGPQERALATPSGEILLSPPAERSAPVGSRSLPPAALCARPEGADAFVPDSGMDAALAALQRLPLAARVECISRRFVGLPYRLDPCGEGHGAIVDPDPPFRFDAHDCMTMAEHVLALAFADSFGDFLGNLQEIRYRGAHVCYGCRLHFLSADWMPENERNGFIRNITQRIGGPATRTVEAEIDHLEWIRKRTDLAGDPKIAAFSDFLMLGAAAQLVRVNFIPIPAFFECHAEFGIMHEEMIARLPEASILLMIDDQEDIDRIGVIVRHMALLFVPRSADGSIGEPFIRHGSSRHGEIYDEPLLDYLISQRPYRAGVAILEISDPRRAH